MEVKEGELFCSFVPSRMFEYVFDKIAPTLKRYCDTNRPFSVFSDRSGSYRYCCTKKRYDPNDPSLIDPKNSYDENEDDAPSAPRSAAEEAEMRATGKPYPRSYEEAVRRAKGLPAPGGALR